MIGSGCPRCRRAYEEVQRAVALARVPATVVRIDDLRELVDYGMFTTPAIVVDRVLRCAGRVPRAAEIAAWLRAT